MSEEQTTKPSSADERSEEGAVGLHRLVRRWGELDNNVRAMLMVLIIGCSAFVILLFPASWLLDVGLEQPRQWWGFPCVIIGFLLFAAALNFLVTGFSCARDYARKYQKEHEHEDA